MLECETGSDNVLFILFLVSCLYLLSRVRDNEAFEYPQFQHTQVSAFGLLYLDVALARRVLAIESGVFISFESYESLRPPTLIILLCGVI